MEGPHTAEGYSELSSITGKKWEKRWKEKSGGNKKYNPIKKILPL